MQLPPPSVLASWPEGNYLNPTETRGPAMLILTFIFAPISLLVVILRVYTRIRISRSFGADDVCIVIATVPTLLCAILSLTAVQHLGWDRHVWDVPPERLITGLKYVMALEIAFGAGCTFTKISLLFFIRKLMSSRRGVLWTLTWVLMAISAVELVIYIIVVINTCRPVSAYWTLSFTPQQCINEGAHLLASGIINTVTDFCVVVLPIPIVLELRLSRRQQVILVALFGAGFVTVFAGVARIYYTYRVDRAYDRTWWAYPLWIAGVVELYLGIIAASLPATKKLVSRYLPKVLGSSVEESQNSQSPLNPRCNNSKGIPRFSERDLEKSLSPSEKHKSLQPVISAFSTWQIKRESTPSPISFWKKIHPIHPVVPQPAIPPTVPKKGEAPSVSLSEKQCPTIPEEAEGSIRRLSRFEISRCNSADSTQSKQPRLSIVSSISSFNVASETQDTDRDEEEPSSRAERKTELEDGDSDYSAEIWERGYRDADGRYEEWRRVAGRKGSG